METRARPTSRGRARCVSFRMERWWEQTAAGPRAGACRLRRRALGDAALPRWGKGRCKCARSTLFALRAKALQSGAPDFGRVAGESSLRGGLPIREISRRAGERGTGRWASPRRGGRYTSSRGRNEPFLLATPTASLSCSERGASQGTPHCLRVSRRKHPARAPKTGFPRPQKAVPHLSRHRFIPQTFPRGARRALPAPAQGINPLRIPFWGTATAFPKMPQADGPCSWACRRLLAPPPQLDRNAARPPPARGAGVRQHGAEGAGSRYYRTAASSAARPET